MDEIKSTGLARQDAFIKSMVGQDFDFGLVMTQAFLKGIRDIGYKSTATALFENIDNAIQAEASNIHVLFDFNKGKSGKTYPDRIAIVDDGYGMSKEMLRVAVLWGGTDRLDDRQGMGKYGYGLPSSCVSIGQRFTVISKREDVDGWYAVTIDLDDIANRRSDYLDEKTGRVIAPKSTLTKMPDFVNNYLQKKEVQLTSGTIILIDKIDRLSRKNFGSLKSFLTLETGITYRNYLRNMNIYIDGKPVEAVDPLFITDGFRYFDEFGIQAKPLPFSEIEVKNQFDETKSGLVKVRYSYMPYGFFGPDAKKRNSGNQGDDDEKSSTTRRLTVRKQNNGIIFLRKGRQIDVIDSKCPWTSFLTNDRHVGVEIDFSPELDEEFAITTSKQQIVLSERLWNILQDAGVYAAIAQMRKIYKKESATAEAERKRLLALSQENLETFVEKLMKDSAKEFEIDAESQPQHIRKEGKENLKKKIKAITDSTGISEDVVEKEIRAQAKNTPYKLDYVEEVEGPFYRAEQIGGQVVIYINKAHRFYTDVFNNTETNPYSKNALALLIFALGHTELRVTDEKRKWYKIERSAWSLKLDTALETLAQHYVKPVEEENDDNELTTG